GEKGVLLLLSDSTNAEVKGHTRSESILAKSFNNIFSSSKGRLFVATFASNIHRIQQVLNAASKYNRNVVLSGITIQKNIGIAIDLNYLSFKDGLLIDLKEAKSLPDKKLAIICTGTQGEPMSALTKMASGKHKHFNIGEGDTVIISASIIPGNEKTVNDVVSSLLKMGAKVHYASDEDIHVSGHAFEDELKLMLSITKPKFFMPIHGEYKHLNAHAKIAEFLNMKSSRIMIAENGDVLSLTKKSFQKEDFLHLKTIFVDGTETGSIESETIKDRIVMSEDGLIVITALIVNREYKPPLQFLVKGFMAPSKKGFYDAMTREIEQKLEMLLLDDEDTNKISSQLKSSLVKYVHRMTKRNPIIEVQVLEV
ncbi:MAG: ribonuclease J, partial [Spirochaetota bacterium]|nr:ribonuclease J [Spirochaetota bacterium]